MSCQPGPPRARHRSVTEVTTKASTGATNSLIKMASFHGAYLKYEYIDSAEFFIWYSEKCLSFCPRLVVPIGNHLATVYPKAPRLLPHACSAMEHAHLIIPIWDMQPRNIGIHRQLSRSGTCNQGTSGYTVGIPPIPDRQMKHARPICKSSAILGWAPILMAYFTGFNHNCWDRGKGLHRLLLDKIVSCYVPHSIPFWGFIGNSHCFREINL